MPAAAMASSPAAEKVRSPSAREPREGDRSRFRGHIAHIAGASQRLFVADLVIFDCDGVLIDSEIIFGRVLGQCMIAADFPVTMDEAMVLGFGKNRITLTAEIEARFDRPLPDGFFQTFRTHVDRAFERELMAIPGIEELLA